MIFKITGTVSCCIELFFYCLILILLLHFTTKICCSLMLLFYFVHLFIKVSTYIENNYYFFSYYFICFLFDSFNNASHYELYWYDFDFEDNRRKSYCFTTCPLLKVLFQHFLIFSWEWPFCLLYCEPVHFVFVSFFGDTKKDFLFY